MRRENSLKVIVRNQRGSEDFSQRGKERKKERGGKGPGTEELALLSEQPEGQCGRRVLLH